MVSIKLRPTTIWDYPIWLPRWPKTERPPRSLILAIYMRELTVWQDKNPRSFHNKAAIFNITVKTNSMTHIRGVKRLYSHLVLCLMFTLYTFAFVFQVLKITPGIPIWNSAFFKSKLDKCVPVFHLVLKAVIT